NGYLQSALILDRIEDYIVRPQLGADAGVLGAIALAWNGNSDIRP
ncbi:MAG: fructokinase, partial [Bryobacterales bacterium]|nr:fructokinase [Bryobacterales bacterium]